MMNMPPQAQLMGFECREGEDGWYTSLHISVRSNIPPDISTLTRWVNQVARATNIKIGTSPLPIPPPRRKLPKAASAAPAETGVPNPSAPPPTVPF